MLKTCDQFERFGPVVDKDLILQEIYLGNSALEVC